MRNIYCKSKIAIVFIISGLLILTSLSSCKKDKDKLSSTTWYGYFNPRDYDFINSEVHITIVFDHGGRGFAHVIVDYIASSRDYGYFYSDIFIAKKATYTYTPASNHVAIEIEWKKSERYELSFEEGKIPIDIASYDGIWAGSLQKDNLTLGNVFGQTVKFIKIVKR